MTSLLPPGSRRAPAIAAIAAALFATGAAADPRSGSGPGEGGTNRLAGETSPYLLQHADNPVDWYPWGEEAFRRAREEDKPVFLSIGYSTCHWCHVMERESFSDAGVARLLNESFISVKVDREERPDVDAVYLAAGRLLDEEVGWPLNLVLTPDGRPFFAASYIPKDDRLGRRGMTTLLPQLAAAWAERRDSITMSADTVALGLRRDTAAGGTLDTDTLAAAYRDLEARFDEANGGFLPAPKFPSPDELRFLLRYWRRSGEAKALAMAEATLAAIRAGAIFDQIGHGVHRYATDAAWRVPHFEKMLYDQAMVSLAYVEAWQATGKSEHRAAADEILGYVLRDLRAPGGAFFAAEDAESGGEEGAFYGWTAAEVRGVLGPEAPLAIEAFGIPAEGRGVPRRAKSAGAIAAERELTAAEVARRIERARKRLFDARETRARPAADRKILADWNGLAIAALAAAGAAFDEPRYTDAAREAARFVLEHLRREGALLHAWTAGSARIAGTLDDHAFLAWGLLNLYEASGEVRWLEAAIELEQQVAT
ncbi:MAG TPA: thioredoxin domain-containing protein, partial [Thermoanaerobaculia bacterium]|nr:thioredoxin domain-containing protein [Thermoanaerobaculia bacterium]